MRENLVNLIGEHELINSLNDEQLIDVQTNYDWFGGLTECGRIAEFNWMKQMAKAYPKVIDFKMRHFKEEVQGRSIAQYGEFRLLYTMAEKHLHKEHAYVSTLVGFDLWFEELFAKCEDVRSEMCDKCLIPNENWEKATEYVSTTPISKLEVAEKEKPEISLSQQQIHLFTNWIREFTEKFSTMDNKQQVSVYNDFHEHEPYFGQVCEWKYSYFRNQCKGRTELQHQKIIIALSIMEAIVQNKEPFAKKYGMEVWTGTASEQFKRHYKALESYVPTCDTA